jgi:hypothetical protein
VKRAHADVPHGNSKVLGDRGVGWPHELAAFEPDCADVNGIRPPVLAQFGPDNSILASALEGIQIVDPGHDGSKVLGQPDEVFADPIDDCFCGLAAKRSTRGNLDGKVVLGKDSLQQNDIGAAAFVYAGNRTQGLEHQRDRELDEADRRWVSQRVSRAARCLREVSDVSAATARTPLLWRPS